MENNTQYSLGDVFFRAIVDRKVRLETCSACQGRGRFVFKPPGTDIEVTARCTAVGCGGGTLRQFDDYGETITPLTVGLVRLEERRDSRIEEYMCKETGIGSGHVYKNTEEISRPQMSDRFDNKIKPGLAKGLFPTEEKAKVFCEEWRGEFLDQEDSLRMGIAESESIDKER